MHIYFSGIGGAGIGPLALIAAQAGYEVSGSDTSNSSYIAYLKNHGVNDIHIGQTKGQIAEVHKSKPIDWLVYSSALPKTDPNHPELVFCQQAGVKLSKRDEFLNQIIKDKSLKLIAIAGTHGKTTTTAMAVWLFKQLGIPVSYSLGAKISFGEMGEFDPASRYFIYEADEYDHNFLSFYPEISLITGIDWDHPDVYPTREVYEEAFSEFLGQSSQAVLWQADAEKLGLAAGYQYQILDQNDPAAAQIALPGLVNRLDAWQVISGLHGLAGEVSRRPEDLVKVMNEFPGVARRFEKIAENIYSDYAHTPPKIRGALQLAREVAGDNVIVVYEGLHNLRQHFIKDELASLFDNIKELYIVPSFLAREDQNLKLLSPDDLVDLLSAESRVHSHAAQLDGELKTLIKQHAKTGDLVLALSAGSGGSLDEWLRQEF